jgi:aminopeptidase N
MFPCFDHPGFKSTFALTVAAEPGQVVIANSPALSETTENGRIWRTFARTPPIPTHLLALAIGPFRGQAMATPAGPITLHALSDLDGEAVLDIAGRGLAFQGAWLDCPYPFGKLDLVALPSAGVAGMENTAAIFFRQAALTGGTPRQVASLVAHELSHQWFGSLVTPASWAELWLNEGFATWMAEKTLAAVAPHLADEAEEVRAVRQAINADSAGAARPLCTDGETPGEIAELFDAIAYRKGAALLRMLEAWLGEPAFQAGVRLYLARHAGGSATSADLWDALGIASGLDVAAVAGPFIQRAGAPRLTVGWAGDQITLSRAADDPRPLPVRLLIGLEDGRRTEQSLLLDRVSLTLTAPGPVAWVFGDQGAVGYYRTVHTAQPPVAALSEVEATVLVEDAWQGLWSGDLDLLQMLDIAADALAAGRGLASLAAHLDELRDLLATGARRLLFDSWIIERLAPDAVGAEALLGEAGALAVVEGATAAARAWITGDRRGDAPAEALLTAARYGGADFFDLIDAALAACEPVSRTPLLRALAAFRLPGRQARQLDLLTDPTLDGSQIQLIAEGLLANPATRGPAWACLKAHWQDLQSKVVGLGGRGAVQALSAFADPAAQADIAAFFHPRDLGGGARALDQALVRIGGRVRFREANQGIFDAWLMRRAAGDAPPSERARLERTLADEMAAGFRGALQQRLRLDAAGLPAPPWMHTADNLRAALASAERLAIQAFQGRPVVDAAAIDLARRLHEDLIANAEYAARCLAKLPLATDPASFQKALALLARDRAAGERRDEGRMIAAALSGDTVGADRIRAERREAQATFAEISHWLTGPPSPITRGARLALRKDTGPVPERGRLHAAALASALERCAVAR